MYFRPIYSKIFSCLLESQGLNTGFLALCYWYWTKLFLHVLNVQILYENAKRHLSEQYGFNHLNADVNDKKVKTSNEGDKFQLKYAIIKRYGSGFSINNASSG